MKLLEIELHNIGPYKESKIVLDTNAKQNIVLICGENGAGKTTLLKAIKLGLFGSFLFGLKQQSRSNTYTEEIKSIVRNNEIYGFVKLKFSIIENYTEVNYELKREWIIDSNIKEHVELKVNDKFLSNDDLLNTIEYINRYFSPKLIELMMFDGEKIINYIDDSIFEDYIKESIIYVNGLNYYLNLIKDLKKHIKNEQKNSRLSIEQLQLVELENNIKATQKEIDTFEEKLKKLDKLNESMRFELSTKVMEFSRLGGLSKHDSSKLLNDIDEMELNRSKNMLLLREFFDKNINYILNKNLLLKTKNQILKERPLKYIEYLNEISISELVEKEDIKVLEQIKKKLIQYGGSKIVNINKDEYLFDQVENKINDAEQMYKHINKINTVDETFILKLKKQVDRSKKDDVTILLGEIETLEKQNCDIQVELEKTLDVLKVRKDQLSVMLQQSEELKDIVYKISKDTDSFIIANKYKEVCEKYFKLEIERICSQISTIATKILKNTYRKENYISKISITTDFTIELYCGSELRKIKQLSAGEKQILIATILVSVIKVSKRNLPLIFDTPAGRLDNIHVSNFYNKIMAQAGNQVIIMPTSKEINDDVLDTIHQKVANVYTLNYQDNGITQINNNKIFTKEWDNDI